MANTRSAIKRIRSSRHRQASNLSVRTHARTAVKSARAAIAAGHPEEADRALRDAYSALDRAAQKGVIHKRNAARRKARLMKQLARSQASTK